MCVSLSRSRTPQAGRGSPIGVPGRVSARKRSTHTRLHWIVGGDPVRHGAALRHPLCPRRAGRRGRPSPPVLVFLGGFRPEPLALTPSSTQTLKPHLGVGEKRTGRPQGRGGWAWRDGAPLTPAPAPPGRTGSRRGLSSRVGAAGGLGLSLAGVRNPLHPSYSVLPTRPHPGDTPAWPGVCACCPPGDPRQACFCPVPGLPMVGAALPAGEQVRPARKRQAPCPCSTRHLTVKVGTAPLRCLNQLPRTN